MERWRHCLRYDHIRANPRQMRWFSSRMPFVLGLLSLQEPVPPIDDQRNHLRSRSALDDAYASRQATCMWRFHRCRAPLLLCTRWETRYAFMPYDIGFLSDWPSPFITTESRIGNPSTQGSSAYYGATHRDRQSLCSKLH